MTTVGKASEVGVIFPEEAKDYMARNREGTYTLLDVRQPAEYERGHLPGARLIPLPLLADSLRDLDPQKPMIVYCAVGGRSRMAVQLLMNQGFREVYHMQGGIEAWEERTAHGPREFHLRFVRGYESPEEIVSVAYGMEEALKRFHETMRERSKDPALIELLGHLIRAEESHERTLLELLETTRGGVPRTEAGSKVLDSSGRDILEGGIDMGEFLSQNEPFLLSVTGYIDLAMMIETQALDLYLRMAAEAKNEQTRNILHRIGEEEKAHLALLGQAMEKNL